MQLITGMHRSGTSLVARLICEAGADLGDPQSFYPADRWNPEGYYEQHQIHAINMPLVHGPWGRLSYLKLPSRETIRRRAHDRAPAIRKTALEFRHRVVKDCRFCLTLAAWQEHGATVERILICLREPMGVARSLQKRNRIPKGLALRLWHEHNCRLLDCVGEVPVWYVSYAGLLDTARRSKETAQALKFMGIDLSESALRALCSKCIKPELNHAPARRREWRYPKAIQQLWERLQERHRQQFSDRCHDSAKTVQSSAPLRVGDGMGAC